MSLKEDEEEDDFKFLCVGMYLYMSFLDLELASAFWFLASGFFNLDTHPRGGG